MGMGKGSMAGEWRPMPGRTEGYMRVKPLECVDCGSEMVGRGVDAVRPLFWMVRARFACGALLESSFSANGNVGRVRHSGCSLDVGHRSRERR